MRKTPTPTEYLKLLKTRNKAPRHLRWRIEEAKKAGKEHVYYSEWMRIETAKTVLQMWETEA